MKNTLLIILYFYILFIASCESLNRPVELISLESDRNFVWSGDPVKLFCNAIDDDNDKIFYFPCSSESELQNAYQEIEVEPTVTEIWDPEPDVINPGNSFRDAPSCLLYTSPSPRDDELSRMPSSA